MSPGKARDSLMQDATDKSPRNRRPIDGSLVFGAIRNGDPNKVYAWVSQSSNGMFGPEYFYQLGYEFEVHRKGGPVVAGMRGAKEGAQVELYGMALMSIDKDLKAELEKSGDGALSTGQDGYDKIMADIRKSAGADNLMRGRRTEGLSAQVDISRLTPERN